MRILHLAAGNRWTGAAAPAFAEVEALRAAGVDAHYAYAGGYKLEEKIGHLDFAHAAIDKSQHPAALIRTVHALTGLGRFDVVHAHLTWDHWIGRFVAKRTGAALARTFHARRVLRFDPVTRLLIAATASVFVINDSFVGAPIPRKMQLLFTPPPVDHRQFTPTGANARATYGIDAGIPVLAVIGKLSKGRGFETALHAFADVRRRVPGARLMIIGHGEHRPALEALASQLGISSDVIWAGYHEADLAEHYRAADLLLFTERGSDEGHRAILEVMACGVPSVTAPLEGVAALLGEHADRLIAADGTPAAIAQRAADLLSCDCGSLKRELIARSHLFGYEKAAQRLMSAYAAIPRPSIAKQS